MITVESPWYGELQNLQSKGSVSERPGSLAGIHSAKRVHQGQFFTPTQLVAAVWRILTPILDATSGKVALFDNAIGSGRLIQFADPKRHEIYGSDIDRDAVTALRQQLRMAGFEHEILIAGMESIRAQSMGIAIINPPFSLTLKAPHLQHLHGVGWGPLGENTQAISHEYALAQALNVADVVAAILPRSYVQTLATQGPEAQRLQVIIHCPKNSFQEEGTGVDVSIALYGPQAHKGAVTVMQWKTLDDAAPSFIAACRSVEDAPAILKHVHAGRASIQLPVTGNTSVRMVKAKRRIGLQFQCGFMQARVMQAIYREDVPQPGGTAYHRYPKGVQYTGEGMLEIEVLMLQDDPQAALQALYDRIQAAGATVTVCPSLQGYFKRRCNTLKRWRTPYRHVVKTRDNAPGSAAQAKAKKTVLVDPAKWGSPVIKKDDTVTVVFGDGTVTATDAKGNSFQRDSKTFGQEFELLNPDAGECWSVRHEGRVSAFPALAHQIGKEIKARGVDKIVSWDYQFHDLQEIRMAPGGIVAWAPGTGKGRLDLALALMGGKTTLIVLEPHLVPELLNEIRDAALPNDVWQVIETPDQARNLKRVNLITYNRLRQALCARSPRTYADVMRRCVSQLIADEGHCLANDTSEQTRALWKISARRRYVLTATPCPNYSRDLLPLASFVAGDATAVQPYGRRRAFLEPRLINSMAYCARGLDQFADDYVETQWVTYRFEDSFRGAKREIPSAKQPEKFRAWAAALVKRRTVKEPEVAKYIKTPDYTQEVVHVPWDRSHFNFYTDVAEKFADWWRKTKATADMHGAKLNMISILAKVGAVTDACTRPAGGVRGFGSYMPLTSKEEAALDLLEQWTSEGRKSIAYASSPTSLGRLERELASRGIASVRIDGTQSIKRRSKAMLEEFRKGTVPVLLASLLCAESGLNLPEASRVLFLERAWTTKAERQAMGRPLRPQQEDVVHFVFLHLPGSIDDYMGQMVDAKGQVVDAYLDAIEPEESLPFLHMETILANFVDGLPSLKKSARLKDAA